MKRQYQVFRAGIPEDQSLDLEPSPWFVGRDVSIPLEHWDLLGEVAARKGHVRAPLWELMSDLRGRRCEPIDMRLFTTGLKLLQRELRTDMATMLTLSSRFPEPLPGSEHARMLEAVIRVFELSGSEADSWVEAEVGVPSGE